METGETISKEPAEPRKEKTPDFFIAQDFSPKETEAIRSVLEKITADPTNFIDKGGAAQVFRLGKNICAKVIDPREHGRFSKLMHLGNPVEKETGILRCLNGVEVDGVRVPWCYGYWKSFEPEKPSVIIMEELDAVNLQHVLNKTAAFPPLFQSTTFLRCLENFLDHMHSLGIIHGDLEPRNVMIDRETGLPRLIDFGRSAIANSKDNVSRQLLINKELEMFDAIAEKIS